MKQNQKMEISSNLKKPNGNRSSKRLSNYYYKPSNPGSYSGLSSLKKHLKNINTKELTQWIQEQNAYTLHKLARKKFPRNRIIVYGIDDTWQADLIDLQKLAKENKDFRYLLSVIDVFSKFAWVIPLKNKTQASIIDSFKKIFKHRKPKRLHTDAGSEFIGELTQKYLKENDIKFYILNSEMKASIVERFNRTLKEKMWRYFTKTKKYIYYNVLKDFVYAYNRTYHRSIKMRPIDVKTKNQNQVFLNLYGINLEKYDYDNVQLNTIKFKVGDQVRISKHKFIFDKGYIPNWTKEIFTINKVVLRDQPVYEIKDNDENVIEGIFYEWELQKVKKPDNVFTIEKVLKTRKNKNSGKTEYLVKWEGKPSQSNSWIANLEDKK